MRESVEEVTVGCERVIRGFRRLDFFSVQDGRFEQRCCCELVTQSDIE
jgi:hypothetical protein